MLLTAGVKLGTRASVDAMGINVGVGFGEKVLHGEMISIMAARTREINLGLENVRIDRICTSLFFWFSRPIMVYTTPLHPIL